MRPLLQHASRFHNANAAAITSSSRPIGRFAAPSPATCGVTYQHRQASTALRRIESKSQPASNGSGRWAHRLFSSSARWMEDKKPPPGSSDPIAMPPPATEQRPKPAASADRTPEQLIERQERLRREWEEQQRKREEEALRKKQQEEEARRRREEEEALRKKREAEALKKKKQQEEEEEAEAARKKQEQAAQLNAQQASQSRPTPESKSSTLDSTSKPSAPTETQKPAPSEPADSHIKKEAIVDNVKRVPDEQLPSHQERQRSNIEKRLTALMDELLPKIAVVTQKVNTFTGTDYSGIEALRREIQEQEKLVKARRLAIDSTKEALDAALEQQAASQKEVVALLERKHSWSSSDLERYMSLIRSEHINDKAVREAKDAVDAAENALEEARSYLEKRERAQYHEEQIWSDTIRRNSTWVTFGLMGVNIFLLLLSLLILEPWRRRRMVREIKTALEAQVAAAEAASASSATTAYVAANPTNPSTAMPATHATPTQKPTEPEVVTDKVEQPADIPAPAVSPVVAKPNIDESPTAGTEDPLRITDEDGTQIGNIISELVEPTTSPSVLGAAPITPAKSNASPQETIDIQSQAQEPSSTSDKVWAKLWSWQSKAAIVAEDIVSDRPISMRRVDFTTAVLQGAAAGAVIAAAAIAMLIRPN